ncbi:MAG: hypothetical protein ACI364_02575 [Coriobacteriales bacterium]
MRYPDLAPQNCPRCGNDWCNLVEGRADGDTYLEYYTCPDCGWTGVCVYGISYLHTLEEDEETVCPGVGAGECPRCHGRTRQSTDWLFADSYLREMRCTECGWKGVDAYVATYRYAEDVEDLDAAVAQGSELGCTLVDVFADETGTKMLRFLGYTFVDTAAGSEQTAHVVRYADFVATMDDVLDCGSARRYEDRHLADFETTVEQIDVERAHDVSRWFRDGHDARRISDYQVNDETPEGFYLIYSEF